jgi:hypothetical protein
MVKLLIIVTRSEEHKWTDRGLEILAAASSGLLGIGWFRSALVE